MSKSTKTNPSDIPTSPQLLLSVTTKAAYNLYLHPLHNHPGPALSACTDLIYWYHFLSGTIHLHLDALHAQYGEVVRFGPDRLSFVHPQAWKDIYGHRTAARKTAPPAKDPKFYGATGSAERGRACSLAAILDDAEHGRVRRIFSHAFSDRGLKEQEPLIRGYVDKLVASLRVSQGASVDMVALYNCTTFDVMGDLTFGESLGLLEASELNSWVSNMFRGIKSAVLGQMSREYPLIGRIIFMLVPASLKKMMVEHQQYSRERVERRLAKQGTELERPDIWGLVLKQEEGRGLTLNEMHAQAGLFMIAGTETTATLLSGLTFLLLKNPDKLSKLAGEVRRSFGSDDQLTIENLRKLKYMYACFEEAFRSMCKAL
ncbi:Cytochrome P450 [Macrophomina phaseolina MS6]|uniref:Cytochrome P450 n=1 Tax=Macrophomina phaseolina (strain MS6) TaxID=1126212 RepID=K2RSY0_MACPH|nr:Cytochrome P450 [Macrophomina phaseolina MS6]